MLTHLRSPARPHRDLPVAPVRPSEPEDNPLQSLDAIEHEDHILVLGGCGPDLMCVLLRAGATRVTHLCSHERPEADSASLVIVPSVPSLDWLAGVLPSIRRALHANGRLVVALSGQQATTQPAVRRMLALHGFSAPRGRGMSGRQVVTAELATFGLRRCA